MPLTDTLEKLARIGGRQLDDAFYTQALSKKERKTIFDHYAKKKGEEKVTSKRKAMAVGAAVGAVPGLLAGGVAGRELSNNARIGIGKLLGKRRHAPIGALLGALTAGGLTGGLGALVGRGAHKADKKEVSKMRRAAKDKDFAARESIRRFGRHQAMREGLDDDYKINEILARREESAHRRR
jgi:hypothetical protein